MKNDFHGGGSRLAYLALGLAVAHAASAGGGEFRTFDGSDNNLANRSQGAAETVLIRLAPNAYQDGIAAPRGGDPTSLPSARAISNEVSAQAGASVPNGLGASDWLWQWGQFLDHDLDLTPGGGADFNIAVPTGDPFFDPMSTGTQTIGLTRALHDDVAGVREQVN